MACADTASGGATTAPSTIAAANGRCGTVRQATSPTTTVVTSGSPTASSPMARRLARMAWYELSWAAEYSNGGRIRNNTRSGSSITSGIPGIQPTARPTVTRIRGADNP